MTLLTPEMLPPPPTGNEGWPWTEGSAAATAVLPQLPSYPKFSIITPNYNREPFLEKTIRSVLLQQYPNLEYIIIDGGSNDGSVDLIRRYEEHLAYWISEPDENQADALNKGFRQSTGDIVAFINSDDFYLPGSLLRVARWLSENPDYGWISGIVRHVDLDGNFLFDRQIPPVPEDRSDWIDRWDTYQPSCFWRGSCFRKTGEFRVDLPYTFDTEFTVRLLFNDCFPLSVDEELAVRVLHDDAKQISNPEIYPLESQLYYPDYAKYLTSEEMPPFYWRQVRRGYGKRRKNNVPLAYLYVAGRAIRHPIWFQKGRQWWSQEEAKRSAS